LWLPSLLLSWSVALPLPRVPAPLLLLVHQAHHLLLLLSLPSHFLLPGTVLPPWLPVQVQVLLPLLLSSSRRLRCS
jgi:hypothetical protein